MTPREADIRKWAASTFDDGTRRLTEDALFLLQLLDEARAERDAYIKPSLVQWDDKDDVWSFPIDEAFPTKSGSHEQYGIAMEMVGNRRSKGSLVALVNWLIVSDEAVRAEVHELRAALRPFARAARLIPAKCSTAQACAILPTSLPDDLRRAYEMLSAKEVLP